MSRLCEVTGKKTARGKKYSIRGIAKKKKGIGLKVTGKTTRTFKPNLVEKKLWFAEENRFVSVRLSTAALRTVNKNGVAAMVKLLRAEGKRV
jgi:large subunit ribosomal protein L28